MNKIDFAIIITATKCNPNGDPLNNNIPRHDINGYGEISNVCIKRKIRDRLYESGENILIMDNQYVTDGAYSIKERASRAKFPKEFEADPVLYRKAVCKQWLDVRTFGQVFAYKSKSGPVSVGVRGPVSIGIATSLETVDIEELKIVKITNTDKNTVEKDKTTISEKYIVNKAAYVEYGSVYPQLASITGFDDSDLEKVKDAMIHIFDNDASSFRPSGSMECTLIWAEHSSKNGSASSAKVHRSFGIQPKNEFPYFEHDIQPISGVNVTVYD